jgi:cysteine synthase
MKEHIPAFHGLCMGGNEEAFARGLYELRERQSEDEEFQYIEIGVASGGTLRTVIEILMQHKKQWRVTGIDIPGGWSLHTEGIRAGLIAIGGREVAPLQFEFPMGFAEVILELDYVTGPLGLAD